MKQKRWVEIFIHEKYLSGAFPPKTEFSFNVSFSPTAIKADAEKRNEQKRSSATSQLWAEEVRLKRAILVYMLWFHTPLSLPKLRRLEEGRNSHTGSPVIFALATWHSYSLQIKNKSALKSSFDSPQHVQKWILSTRKRSFKPKDNLFAQRLLFHSMAMLFYGFF